MNFTRILSCAGTTINQGVFLNLDSCILNNNTKKILENTFTIFSNGTWLLACVNSSEMFTTFCNDDGIWDYINCTYQGKGINKN